MILVTGGAGFIGSVLVGYLNSKGVTDIIISDKVDTEKLKNLSNKKFKKIININEFPKEKIKCIVHLGADSNTLQKDWETIYDLNILSTRKWYDFSQANKIPMIFTSSASVYGNGNGPTNLYSFSKKCSESELANSVILRLFNVYGPNEYHKSRMASTIYHWHRQLISNNTIEIFQNSDNFFRDFIYVFDVAKIICYFIDNFQPGIFDVGIGISRSFETIADIAIDYVGYGTKKYIEMPSDLKHQYQKNTLANLTPLSNAGFDTRSLMSLEQGISDYFKYLDCNEIY